MGLINRDRGLTIQGTDYCYWSEGAYGIIFAEKAARSIIKVYKKELEEDHVRSVFKSEIDAYNLAAFSEKISALIPGNFQLIPPIQVTDERGRDITDEFFPDLAFQTDFVKGDFCKIGVVNSAEALRVRQLFWEAGIHHTTDMSVTIGAKDTILKAIDFATAEHELMHRE